MRSPRAMAVWEAMADQAAVVSRGPGRPRELPIGQDGSKSKAGELARLARPLEAVARRQASSIDQVPRGTDHAPEPDGRGRRNHPGPVRSDASSHEANDRGLVSPGVRWALFPTGSIQRNGRSVTARPPHSIGFDAEFRPQPRTTAIRPGTHSWKRPPSALGLVQPSQDVGSHWTAEISAELAMASGCPVPRLMMTVRT